MPAFVSPLGSPSTWELTLGTAVLPVTSRYGARTVSTLVAVAPAGGGRVHSPARALLRVHSTTTGVVLELEPEPFAIQAELRTLAAGVPCFYIGLDGAVPSDFSLLVGNLVSPSVTLSLVAASSSVWIAIVAQERLTLPMTTWATRIRDAMSVASSSWNDFSTAVFAEVPAARAPVFVLDASGSPLNGTPIDVSVGADNFSVTLSPADGGDLQRAVIASGRPPLWSSATSATLSIAGGPSVHRWVPLHDDDTPFDGTATVTPASPHVMFTSLDAWFAEQHVQTPSDKVLPRFTSGNRVDFFLDGAKYFRNVVEEARLLRGSTDPWVVFSNWGFSHGFKLGPQRGARATNDPTFMEVLEELCGPSTAPPVQVRLLLNRFIQIEDQTALWIGWALLAILALFEVGLAYKFELAALESGPVGLGLLIVALVYIAVNIPGNDMRSMEKNVDPFDAINSSPFNANARAIWSALPVTKADNPFATQPLPIELETAGALHYGVHHTKALAMRRGNTVIGFVGGMDIVENRRDDPRRLASGPYNDVQAKVEGPAAVDLARTLLHRWTFDVARETDFGGAPDPKLLPALTVPIAEELTDGTEFAQIARTYPRIRDASRQLDFAPNGDFTIHDTLIQAIRQAREFIYIGDQYFNPGVVYRQALLDALPNIQRLIVMNPTFGDQPLGDFRRRDFIQQLKAAAPDRVIIRAPVRRPTMPPARTRASMGRVFLRSTLPAVPGLAEEIVLGPDSRLPKPPFWVVIDGEAIYATEQMPTMPTDADGTRRFRVKRGSAAAPGIHPRDHIIGAPAAIVNRTGIYLHAKIMVVDDVFLSIGSANLNRRGLKHDGETNIFTVPMALRRTSANLARKLRIATWADHLDLPPAIAAPLLHDPIRGSDLFLREYERGNRATEIDLVGFENVVPGLLTMPTSSFFLNLVSIFGLSVVPANDEAIWNTLADPTTDDL